MRYAAFLRGINVGGNKKVPMSELKKCLEKLGYENVKTLLNSGNVIFETKKTNPISLTKTIESTLEKTFGFKIKTMIRSLEEIEKLIESNPFKGIKVTPNTRLYVTFLSEAGGASPDKGSGVRKGAKERLKLPYTTPDKAYKILKATDTEVCSVLTVTPNSRSVDAMDILEEEYGSNVTTRNWNTIVKMLK
jgi:uncharacterized protein (DUF1697 family)